MKHRIYQGYKRKYGKISFTLLFFGLVLFISLLIFGIKNLYVIIGFGILLYIQYKEGKKKKRMLISASCPTCGELNAVIEPVEYGVTFKTECFKCNICWDLRIKKERNPSTGGGSGGDCDGGD